ncbi:MAG: hypothetical protein EU532_10770, partial [Promethearchaeota archaeon]
MDAKKIIIIPTTHWDREWYVPFNEFRAYLVLMMDKLIEILKTDKDFTNFTLDGQVIALEDYLEVKSEKEDIIKKLIQEKRLSIGPFYNLPDEFLVSGESLIRNLLLGHILGRKYGRVMKAGYIPDTFGHIAQLPQIFSGFEIPSALFMRGFGNELEENNLNMEFLWNAPGNSASVLGIHLIRGYSSAASLNTTSKNSRYNLAIGQLKRAIRKLERYIGSNVVILNNGSDHLFPQPEVSEIVKQWNEEYTDKQMEINDVEYYINEVLSTNSKLNSYEGEFRGGKYHPLLSGVFSARMWIKQKNTKIEYLYEKYTEPLSTITWILDKYNNFEYPSAYIWTGLKWLMKNHPHDSICGCSIDEVHEDMITRFKWAEEIGNEILTNSLIYLSKLININEKEKDKSALIIFNPLPWDRTDITYFDIIIPKEYDLNKFVSQIRLTDYQNNDIEYQIYKIKEIPRYWQEGNTTIRISFIGSIPACGYKIYYVYLKNTPTKFIKDTNSFKMNKTSLE